MSVTAEQWAQAEAERRPDDLGYKGLRVEQFLPTPPPQAAGRRIIDTRIGEPPAPSGDKGTCWRLEFQVALLRVSG